MRYSGYFLVSILLVKSSMDISTIGSYEYVWYLASILTSVWLNGIVQSFVVHSKGGDEAHIKQYFQRFSLLLLFSMSLLFACFYFWGQTWLSWLHFESVPAGFYHYLFFHFVLSGSYILVYKYMLLTRVIAMYVFGLSYVSLYVLAFLTLFWTDYALVDVFILLAWFALPFLIFWVIEIQIWSIKKNFKLNWKGLSALVLIQWIGYISIWSDGWWVQYYYGIGEWFTYFRYGGREFPLFIILTSSFTTFAIGLVSTKGGLNEELSRIRDGSRRFIKGFWPVVFFLMISSTYLFQWVYSPAFISSAVIFDLYIWIVVVRVVFVRSIYMGQEWNRPLVWISLMELMINFIASFYFHMFWGVLGLILATLLAHGIELLVSILYLQYKKGIHWRQYIPAREFVVFALGISCLLVAKYLFFSPFVM